jgi:hypothetical protein
MKCIHPEIVIPGRAVLGANPESSSDKTSGFRVRAEEGASRNDEAGSSPAMTEYL